MKKKVCNICKRIHEEGVCPNCGPKEFTNNFKGRIVILNKEKSIIAKNLKIISNGEFAIKSR